MNINRCLPCLMQSLKRDVYILCIMDIIIRCSRFVPEGFVVYYFDFGMPKF